MNRTLRYVMAPFDWAQRILLLIGVFALSFVVLPFGLIGGLVGSMAGLFTQSRGKSILRFLWHSLLATVVGVGAAVVITWFDAIRKMAAAVWLTTDPGDHPAEDDATVASQLELELDDDDSGPWQERPLAPVVVAPRTRRVAGEK